MMIWNALYIGDAGLRKNYSVQIGRIVRETRRTLGALPIFFGETGIPMDINNGEGQYQGEWRVSYAGLWCFYGASAANTPLSNTELPSMRLSPLWKLTPSDTPCGITTPIIRMKTVMCGSESLCCYVRCSYD